MAETERALAALMRGAAHSEAIKSGIQQNMQAGKVKSTTRSSLAIPKVQMGNW